MCKEDQTKNCSFVGSWLFGRMAYMRKPSGLYGRSELAHELCCVFNVRWEKCSNPNKTEKRHHDGWQIPSPLQRELWCGSLEVENVIQTNDRKQLEGLWEEGGRSHSACSQSQGEKYQPLISTSAANISNLHGFYLQLVVALLLDSVKLNSN